MTKDAEFRPELTDRQLRILSALIRTYTQRPEPISSKQLVDDYDLGISSATVRNELAVLEQLGMIRAPHTSAGRIPTEEGYRYFVQRLITSEGTPLNTEERLIIKAEFEEASQDLQRWLQSAAAILARQTRAIAVVTEPRSRAARFKHLQLINTHGRVVLMILVLEGGEISQQMLMLAEDADQERLTQIAASINDQSKGETGERIRQRVIHTSDLLTAEVLELVADGLEQSEQGDRYTLYSTGLGDSMAEFEENAGVQQAVRALDEARLLKQVFAETIQDEENGLRVIVGGDGRMEEISHLSIVVGRYGNNNLAGAISVLGPTRMRYGRAISTVRYIATLMSDIVNDVYGSQR